MTKYRLEVGYQFHGNAYGWYWLLREIDENGRITYTRTSRGVYMFRWTAILGGRLAARKTPYTKEFTI